MTLKPPVAATAGVTDSIAYPLRSRIPINAGDYGLSSTATDNGPAINAAIDALPAAGGTVTIPRGTYNYTTPIDLAGLRSVTLRGEGNAGGSLFGMGTVLQYTATGTTSPVSINSSAQGIALENLDFRYTSSSFTGKYVNCQTSHDLAFRHCQFAANPSGGTVATAGAYLRLDQTYNVKVEKCWFKNGVRAVTGKESTSSFSNAVVFDNCGFIAQTTSHILDSGGSWTFNGCTFEGIAGDLAGAYNYTTANLPQHALSFIGCWFGDVTSSGAGQQINFGGTSLNVIGCTIAFETTPAKGIVIAENNCHSINIVGNRVKGSSGGTSTFVDFGATTGHLGVVVGPNYYEYAVTIVNNPPATGWYFDSTGGFNLTSDLTFPGSKSIIQRVQANAVAAPHVVKITGDTQDRWRLTADGKLTRTRGNVADNVIFHLGTGTPEGVVTAGIGSIFQRIDGGAGTSMYVKESGTGNTGWVAK